MYETHQFSDAEDEKGVEACLSFQPIATNVLLQDKQEVQGLSRENNDNGNDNDDDSCSDDYYDDEEYEAEEDDLNAADAWAEATGGKQLFANITNHIRLTHSIMFRFY
jgi:hypothetical protein